MIKILQPVSINLIFGENYPFWLNLSPRPCEVGYTLSSIIRGNPIERFIMFLGNISAITPTIKISEPWGGGAKASRAQSPECVLIFEKTECVLTIGIKLPKSST